ncbi:MAG: DUF222 domain-containing protein [Pseudonocardiaceae bacterium]
MTTVEEDRTQARIHGLLATLRDAETDFRRSYARVLDVVAELEQEKAGPRVITATIRRIPANTHPDTTAQAEHTLATAASRFDPAALTRIGERILAHLDPDSKEPTDEPEEIRELRVRTGTSDANNAWPSPHYATPSRNATKDAPSRPVTDHPATATLITWCRGWTGVRRNYPNKTPC